MYGDNLVPHNFLSMTCYSWLDLYFFALAQAVKDVYCHSYDVQPFKNDQVQNDPGKVLKTFLGS